MVRPTHANCALKAEVKHLFTPLPSSTKEKVTMSNIKRRKFIPMHLKRKQCAMKQMNWQMQTMEEAPLV